MVSNIFLCLPRTLGKMNPFWLTFFKGVGSTTNWVSMFKMITFSCPTWFGRIGFLFLKRQTMGCQDCFWVRQVKVVKCLLKEVYSDLKWSNMACFGGTQRFLEFWSVLLIRFTKKIWERNCIDTMSTCFTMFWMMSLGPSARNNMNTHWYLHVLIYWYVHSWTNPAYAFFFLQICSLKFSGWFQPITWCKKRGLLWRGYGSRGLDTLQLER